MSAHSLCHTHTHTHTLTSTLLTPSPPHCSPHQKFLRPLGIICLCLFCHTHTHTLSLSLSLSLSIRNSILPPARARLSFLSLTRETVSLCEGCKRRSSARAGKMRGNPRPTRYGIFRVDGWRHRVRGNFHVAYRGWALPPKKSGTCRRHRFFLVRNIAEMRELNNKTGIFCLNIPVFLEKKISKFRKTISFWKYFSSHMDRDLFYFFLGSNSSSMSSVKDPQH
jgi:hypothetical protein